LSGDSRSTFLSTTSATMSMSSFREMGDSLSVMSIMNVSPDVICELSWVAASLIWSTLVSTTTSMGMILWMKWTLKGSDFT
jgi:hypothetical protein